VEEKEDKRPRRPAARPGAKRTRKADGSTGVANREDSAESSDQ
jgi:hypothetical protein